MQRFECALEVAGQDYGSAQERLKARIAWATELLPLLDQFEFTPWVEIPQAAQDRIHERMMNVWQESLAKTAIEQQKPVSQVNLECRPEHPHCFEIGHPDNQHVMGQAYVLELQQQLKRFMSSAATADGRDIRVALEFGPPDTALLWSAGARTSAKEVEASRLLVQFIDMLPESAITPPMPHVETPEDPPSCQGIFSRAKHHEVELPAQGSKPQGGSPQ